MAGNDYTRSPARVAAVESRRGREVGVAVAGNLAGPTLRYDIGSLVQMGICTLSTAVTQIHTGALPAMYSPTKNARRAMAVPRHQREPPLWSRGERVRV